MEPANQTWTESNRQYLLAAMTQVRVLLSRYHARMNNAAGAEEEHETLQQAQEIMDTTIAAMPAQPALEVLAAMFGLSAFEKQLLVLCAGAELDSTFAAQVAAVQGNPQATQPTFSLALAALPDAHWSAVSPGSPLRYWRILQLQADQLLTKAPLKIDEYILHYLTGIHHLDERLSGVADAFTTSHRLVPSQQQLAETIVQAIHNNNRQPAAQGIALTGANKTDKDSIAGAVCRSLGVYACKILVQAIPGTAKEIMELARIWNREAALKSYALLLDYTDADLADKPRMQLIRRFTEQVQSLLIISCEEVPAGLTQRPLVFAVGKPGDAEQRSLWKQYLGDESVINDIELRRLVAQFDFSAADIDTVGAAIAARRNGAVNGQLLPEIWQSCCLHARPDTGELTQPVHCIATMDDLVLPAAQKDILRDLITQVKHRATVYNDWGFAGRSNRGMGITALFAGESGTGKTMAAEVVAGALQLDLYRVDLSQVISKYIGETEKNLKRIFDAAEAGGAILLFDEADALFGKRSEVKDSHDRYANVEISYLLQRMEAYRGLAILTTNMKSTMDKAWMRRIRFVVQFPFPDASQRAEIWKRIFPSATPTHELDMDKLAKLNIAGGNIRNIALNAAFIAAGEAEAVNMQHVQRALRTEFEKLEKPLTNTEVNLLK